jgi:hypothetical protein
MTSDRIRELYSAQPFRPFTLHLADGSRARIVSPEFMMFPPGGRTIVVYTQDSGVEFIDLLLVTKVSVASTNGSKRRRRHSDDQ